MVRARINDELDWWPVFPAILLEQSARGVQLSLAPMKMSVGIARRAPPTHMEDKTQPPRQNLDEVVSLHVRLQRLGD